MNKRNQTVLQAIGMSLSVSIFTASASAQDATSANSTDSGGVGRLSPRKLGSGASLRGAQSNIQTGSGAPPATSPGAGGNLSNIGSGQNESADIFNVAFPTLKIFQKEARDERTESTLQLRNPGSASVSAGANVGDSKLGGAASQQIVKPVRGDLGNVGLNQINAEINQASGLRQQNIQDGNSVGSSEIDRQLNQNAEQQVETQNQIDSAPGSVDASAQDQFEILQNKRQALEQQKLQEADQQAEAHNSSGQSGDGGNSSNGGNSSSGASGDGSSDDSGARSPQDRGIDEGGGKHETGSHGRDGDGGNGIFQDPTRGGGGIGVQNGVETPSVINENVGAGLESNLQNAGNRVRGFGALNNLNGAGVEVRSLKLEDGGGARSLGSGSRLGGSDTGRGSGVRGFVEQDNLSIPKSASPFASGNFRQGFAAPQETRASGGFPVNINTRENFSNVPGARLSPNLIPGAPSVIRTGLPTGATGAGGARGASLPINIQVPGRLPGTGAATNLGGIRTGLPSGFNVNRVPSVSGVRIPTAVPSLGPVNIGGAFRPSTPSVTNIGAGRLPISTPGNTGSGTVGGAARGPVIQRSGR